MSANRMNEMFAKLGELTPVQRWAVGQVLRAFPDEHAQQVGQLRTVRARKQQELVLAFVEECCEFAAVVITDADVLAAFNEWRGNQPGDIPMTQNGIAQLIASSFPERVRRRRLGTNKGYRPRALSGIKLREPATK
jgi:hypothetical protein